MERIDSLLNRVPGYAGYRDKENRRDTDKRVRESIVAALNGPISRIESSAADLANRREIMSVGPVDTVAKSARHLQDQIRVATYGYGGIGSDRTVDAAAIDQLVEFDRDLLARVDTLNPLIDALAAATDDPSRMTALGGISSALASLQSTFDERQFVIETGRPSTRSAPTSPLGVLETDGTKPLPAPALQLKKGDALAVGGANFIIDAVVELKGASPTKLLRIDVGPERWLVVNQRFGADTVRKDVAVTGATATVDGQTLNVHGGGSAETDVTGLGGSDSGQTASYQVFGGDSVNGPVAIVVTWPSAKLSLSGVGLDLAEIEIFGAPGNR